MSFFRKVTIDCFDFIDSANQIENFFLVTKTKKKIKATTSKYESCARINNLEIFRDEFS